MPGQIHRTAVFTIHDPTRRVRAILEKTFSAYTHAYTIALHHFSTYTVDELYAMAIFKVDDKGQARVSTKKLVQNAFGKDIPAIRDALTPLEGSMRESLKEDVAETLLSFVELSRDSKQHPSYPERLRKQDRDPLRIEALEAFRLLADNKEKEDELRAEILRTKQVEAIPLSFVRIDPERNCGLFYNPETRKFYARLSVVSPRSRLAKPITLAGKYIDVRSGTVYTRQEDSNEAEGIESFGRGKGSILVPLEMGKWHEEPLRFLQQGFLPQRLGKSTDLEPVSARLVKRKDSYQLHVAFRLPKPERIHTETYLGINRGINCIAAGAVVSADTKRIITTYIADGKELRGLLQAKEQLTKLKQQKGKIHKGDHKRARIADKHVHITANQIVTLALEHHAQVVMEDLQSFSTLQKKPKGIGRNMNRLMSKRQYQKLQDVTSAKLALVGLPSIRVVNAAFVSLTCSACGNIDVNNRVKEDYTKFVCTSCGHTDQSDVQAGVNIARKVPWISLRSKEKQAGKDESERTPWARFAQELAGSTSK